ncbi:hypothetical protein CHUAL_012943 [Chamberlinius hualienensis]
MAAKLKVTWIFVTIIIIHSSYAAANFTIDCNNVRMGQYLCKDPDVDPQTQQPRGCTKEGHAKINCTLTEGLVCNNTFVNTFEMRIDCKYTNGKSFETALLLSVFLGTFGVDRFYLGYPALGLVKLCTLGFMFLGQFIDIILIATQTLGPSDGSNYVINYYGPGIEILKMNNETYKHRSDSNRLNVY